MSSQHFNEVNARHVATYLGFNILRVSLEAKYNKVMRIIRRYK